MPQGAQSVQAKVADQPVVRLVAHDSADAYSVPLPAGRQCVVVVTYATRDLPAPWYWSSELANPLPRCTLPILHRTWQLQLAPGLELANWTSLPARRLESGEHPRTTDGPEQGDPRSSDASWNRYEIDPARADGRGLWVCANRHDHRLELVPGTGNCCPGGAAGRRPLGMVGAARGLLCRGDLCFAIESCVPRVGVARGTRLGGGLAPIGSTSARCRRPRRQHHITKHGRLTAPGVGSGYLLRWPWGRRSDRPRRPRPPAAKRRLQAAW